MSVLAQRSASSTHATRSPATARRTVRPGNSAGSLSVSRVRSQTASVPYTSKPQRQYSASAWALYVSTVSVVVPSAGARDRSLHERPTDPARLLFDGHCDRAEIIEPSADRRGGHGTQDFVASRRNKSDAILSRQRVAHFTIDVACSSDCDVKLKTA